MNKNMPRKWEEYIQNTLLASGYVTHAAIYGIENMQKWGASPDFDISSREVRAIYKGFTDPANLHVEKISVAGQKYTMVRNEISVIIGKRSKEGGCVITRCNQLLIIAVFEDPAQAANCLNLTTKLAEYFRNIGF